MQENTFFPKDWTKRQTKMEMNHAFRNSSPDPVDPLYWIGRASDGTPMTGRYADPSAGVTGGWKSAYPIYNYKGGAE